LTGQLSLKTRGQVVQHVTALLTAGCRHRQHPLDEATPALAVRPAADPSPVHRVPCGTLRRVIRRLNPPLRTKVHSPSSTFRRISKHVAAVLAQPQRWPRPNPALTSRRSLAMIFGNRAIDRPVADPMPPSKQSIRITPQLAPDRRALAPTVDLRLEVAPKGRPADRPPGRSDLVRGAEPVARDDLVRFAPQERLGHVAGSAGGAGEDGRSRGHGHSPPGRAPVLPP
jgi:hypothetical protein